MRYITLPEQIRLEGNRHAARAAEYLAAGKPDYAAGSMRKAQRKWKQAAAFEDAYRISITPTIRASDAL